MYQLEQYKVLLILSMRGANMKKTENVFIRSLAVIVGDSDWLCTRKCNTCFISSLVFVRPSRVRSPAWNFIRKLERHKRLENEMTRREWKTLHVTLVAYRQMKSERGRQATLVAVSLNNVVMKCSGASDWKIGHSFFICFKLLFILIYHFSPSLCVKEDEIRTINFQL